MANIDGLPVNSAVTHAEFVARTEDTSTTGLVNFQNTTDSTTPTTGSIKTAGGLGVAKSLNVGENLSVSGNLGVTGELTVTGETTLNDTLNASTILTPLIEADQIESPVGNITTVNSVNVNTTNLSVTAGVTFPSLNITNDLVVTGNLTVNGTSTTLNTATIDSEDPNITINKNGNDASSEGSGLTVDRTGTKGSFVYENALASKFKIGALASEAEVTTVSHTQTLTNKTLTSPVLTTPSVDIISATEQGSTPATPASGVRKLYPKADGFYQLDSTGLETKVGSGSGSGSGVVNLIANGSAEDAVSSIFIPYKDTGTRPIDGTGGSPSVGTSVTTTNPLNGLKSYLLTKPSAASYQGEGWALPATALDHAFRAKALKISFDYIVNAGTFVAGTSTTDGDIIWTCYDITNSKIVEPSNIKMLTSSTTISDKFEATVQFDSNCTSFRLIAHVASSSTQLIQIKVDNITVTPQNYVYGTPITDWQAYTPTINGVGTPASVNFAWRRVGDSIQVVGSFITGTPTGATAEFTLPAGLTANTSVISTYTYYGDWIRVIPTASTRKRGKLIVGAGSNIVGLTNDDYTTALGPASALAGNAAFAATESVKISAFNIPVTGWSSSVRISDSFDGRIITAKATRSTAFSLPNNTTTKVVFDVVSHDDVAGFSSGTYTVRSAGKYRFAGHLNLVGNAATFELVAYLYVNGSAVEAISFGKSGTAAQPHGCTYDFQRHLSVGDTVEIWGFQNSGAALNLRANDTVFGLTSLSVERISGPQAIASSEVLSSVYTTAAGQSIPNATDTIINFADAEVNTHGNVTTGAAWKFTAQTAGLYEVSAFTQLASGGGWGVSEEALITLFKNGSSFARIGLTVANVAHTSSVPISCVPRQIRLNAGDYIDLRINQNSGAAISLVAVGSINWVSIKKVG